MNNIIQNAKSGFANIKELFKMITSTDDLSHETYDIYINSTDTAIAETAKILKEIERDQEEKRLSIFLEKVTKKRISKKTKPENSKEE